MNTVSLLPKLNQINLHINGRNIQCIFFGTSSNFFFLKSIIKTNTKLTIFNFTNSEKKIIFLCCHKKILSTFKYIYKDQVTIITPIYLCINNKTNELYWEHISNIPQEMK